MLEDMALGREVQLFYAGLTRDRYDRTLAHVMTTDALGPDLWLNREMVARGGARVRVYPDTAVRARGYVCGGKLEIGHTLNLETLAGN
jgi:endonuclease YncB( thermonuclease family)